MDSTSRARFQLRLHALAFLLLFGVLIGLTAWLSTRYVYETDWSASGRNSLSEGSRELLARLDGPIHVTAYAREDEILRKRISGLLRRYQRHYPQMDWDYVNPDAVPDRIRQLGITVDGELVIAYQARAEHVQVHSEEALTNALQRVARSGERWVAFTTGHGERRLDGKANHDLGAFGQRLETRGFKLQALELADARAVPANTSLLVVAGPRVDFLPGEERLVVAYVQRGGNLLWLGDPGPLRGLEGLARTLGVRFHPGVLVDPSASVFGVDRADFVVVADYASHPVTEGFNLVTLFPQASGIEVRPPEGWKNTGILRSNARTWSETGSLEDTVSFDPATDIPGPVNIGIALQRTRPGDPGAAPQPKPPGDVAHADGEQRIVVIGDGDFLSNSYLGNAGNLDLGTNLFNWLSADDTFISIPARAAPDRKLELSAPAQFVIAVGALFGMPMLLLGAGLTIWLRRRRR